MTHDMLEKFHATAVRKHYANITTPWALGYNNRELELPTLERDPFYVLREAPPDMMVFRFYDRIVAPIVVDGEEMEIRTERLEFSKPQFFVNIKRIISRDETDKWWKKGYDKYALMEMNDRGVDHVVEWANHRHMAFRPDIDVLLVR